VKTARDKFHRNIGLITKVEDGPALAVYFLPSPLFSTRHR
jgi:hypothetical protein